MSRKILFTLATAATIAAAATLASSAADARGFGGGGFGGGGHFGGGGFSRGSFGGSHFVGGNHFGGRGFAGFHPRGPRPGWGHPVRWTHYHNHRWFWRDGRWIDGEVGGYDAPAPVAAVGPCTCLTKTYTQDGLVVFADVCTKEAASAPVGGAEVTPPAKSSEATPPAPPANVADASQAPTTNNYAGKTYQDFLAANSLAQKN